MHDFHCRQASQMYSPVLAARVRELKERVEKWLLQEHENVE